MIKAVFRSLGVSAMKGNRLAQATMAELVRGVEEEDRQLRSSHFETACEYKISWEQAIDRIDDPLPDRYRKRLENRFYPGIIAGSGAEDEE